MRTRKGNAQPRPRRGNPFQSTMPMCRNQLWFGIFTVFAAWSLLVFLNYSSLILSVRSLANVYVYSGNQQDSLIPLLPTLATNQSNRHQDSSSPPDDDNVNTPSTPFKPYANGMEESGINNTNHPPLNGVDVIKVLEDSEPLFPPPPPTNRRQRRRGKRRGARIIKQPSANNFQFVKSTTVPPPPAPPPPGCKAELKSDPKSCQGRYIYVHILPRRYHVDLLRDCSTLDLWTDMCQYVKNSGLGPPLSDSEPGWFATNQFLLEVIFHNRMKTYDCLTNDSAQATAVFVPFYAGLDVARHLWNADARVRDASAFELLKWLRRKPEWSRFWGRDHFFVGGRITWDFRRSESRKDPDWGTKLLYLPEARNMTALVIESSPWNSNDFGIPYPTYFHPSSDDQVFSWQARIRARSRKFLFSFAGAPRPDRPDSIRNQLITQCRQSRRCNMVECNNWDNKCHKPAELMKVFQDSHFCLQPPGDSYTRRSTFDSIVAGCIPVFFHPGSAYTQYYWHLPRDYKNYSVFIPMKEVRSGKVSVEGVLERISTSRVERLREEVVKLIPRLVYADPRCRLETLADAFDVAVEGVLKRVRRVKEDLRVGRNESFGYDETQAWKHDWLGRLEQHEWDSYFSDSFDDNNTSL